MVLALFVPLIISSGGNSGSQASTLVIRAMALGEVRVCATGGASSGAKPRRASCWAPSSASIGLARILTWQVLVRRSTASSRPAVGLTVAVSLLGVVAVGHARRLDAAVRPPRLGLDPASASAPFVATLVDVTGLLIYFTVASVVLRGTLL